MSPTPLRSLSHRAPGARRAAVAAALGAVLACASPPAGPQWLGGEPADYPAPRWLHAVGSGPDPGEASLQARRELVQRTGAGPEVLQLADTWVDPRAGRHWALVVLDREPLRRQMRAELAELDATIRRGTSPPSPIRADEALAAAVEALDLLPRRHALRARLARLEGEAPPDEAALLREREALEARLAAVRRFLPVEVEAFERDLLSGEAEHSLDPMRRRLAQEVLEQGFPLQTPETEDQRPTWLVARSSLGLERQELGEADELVAVLWEAALEISDQGAGGELVAIVSESGRAVHFSEREARRIAREQATLFASEALAEWLRQRGEPAASPAPRSVGLP